jgi:hypothetical protein
VIVVRLSFGRFYCSSRFFVEDAQRNAMYINVPKKNIPMKAGTTISAHSRVCARSLGVGIHRIHDTVGDERGYQKNLEQNGTVRNTHPEVT